MTPREPSEAAVEAALDAFDPDWRYWVDELEIVSRNDMRNALRAAYAVDAKNGSERCT